MAENLTVGLAAHVDAGKTTLSEAMLFLSGTVRKQGRVDHGGPQGKLRGPTRKSRGSHPEITWAPPGNHAIK